MSARRSSYRVGLGVGLCLGVGAALPIAARLAFAAPQRPPEALEQERHEQAIALDYLVRKTDSLSTSLVERRGHLRKRLRAMYKMSQGGYLRLMLGAESPTDSFARRNAAERILERDVAELEAVREELGELAGLREKLRAGEQRAAALLAEAQIASREGLSRKGAFRKPVDGKIVRAFGPYRDESGLEFTRDGVDIECAPGELVHAPAAGGVRSAGELAGLGPSGVTVVIDHGDGWVSVVSGLRDARVRLGAHVPAGFPIGAAGGYSVHFELSQGGTWIDPASFL